MADIKRENQLTKTLRLVRELEVNLVKYPENESIDLKLDSAGRGDLIYTNVDGNEEELFSFSNVEVLTKYLEGDQLTRLLMTLRLNN